MLQDLALRTWRLKLVSETERFEGRDTEVETKDLAFASSSTTGVTSERITAWRDTQRHVAFEASLGFPSLKHHSQLRTDFVVVRERDSRMTRYDSDSDLFINPGND
jgi:hypothetical protein